MTDTAQPASVYDLAHEDQAESLATFAVLVDNEPGVLHRLVGLFAARGYNIESLTVAETDHNAHTSRVTIVTRGTLHVLSQIEAQLTKMVSTRHVQDVTRDPNGLERELALVKVKGTGSDRVEALRVADIFRAKVIDTTHESFVFELTGAATFLTKDPRFMMAKPSIVYVLVGAAMLERGWMLPYLPPIARQHLDDSVMIGWGYVWAGLMFLTAALNAGFALGASLAVWSLFIAVFPAASKIGLFAVHFISVKAQAIRNARRAEAAASAGPQALLAA